LTRDISGSGVAIVIEENIPVGKFVEIILPLEEEKLTIECMVVRSSSKVYGLVEKYELGLSYLNLSDKSRYKIIKYIFKQQRLQIFKERNIKNSDE